MAADAKRPPLPIDSFPEVYRHRYTKLARYYVEQYHELNRLTLPDRPTNRDLFKALTWWSMSGLDALGVTFEFKVKSTIPIQMKVSPGVIAELYGMYQALEQYVQNAKAAKATVALEKQISSLKL